MSRRLASAIIALCLSAPAPGVRGQTPVVTKLVQFYTGAERRLAEAINRGDTGEIDRLVAGDFELRSAANIGVPVSRADWLAQSLTEGPASVSIGQMAVHEYGNLRIVSFLMTRTAAGAAQNPSTAAATAVVDIWMQSADSSVLEVRYAAARGAAPGPVPGQVPEPQINKRF
jgi:hypothetical protein